LLADGKGDVWREGIHGRLDGAEDDRFARCGLLQNERFEPLEIGVPVLEYAAFYLRLNEFDENSAVVGLDLESLLQHFYRLTVVQ
jgi:hypothetical protein